MNKYIGKYPNISELIVSDDTRIISLSDIHGDIHSLIIALRDCSEVIKKNNYVNDKEDIELELLLNIDISETDNGYIDSLNYNWVGKNTHIVIIGDFLDITRKNNIELQNYDYPQIEIKIFRFINAINKQALLQGGRIIKMFGNHEMNNIIGKKKFIKRYSLSSTIKLKNYYRGNNRIKCFKYGNEGYKLMLEGGMYLLFKINNNLFVHGGPTNNFDFNDYNKINYIINNNTPNTINVINDLCNTEADLSPLWTRIFGNDSLINKRIYDNDEFCNYVKKLLIKIKGNEYFNDNVKMIRIIVGHCVQSLSTMFNKNNTTFSYINKEKSNNIKEVLEPKLEIINDNDKRIVPNKLTLLDDYKKDYFNYNSKLTNNKYDVKYRGIADLKKRIVFGITMECDNDLNSADNYIYKVDVGVSRGFDNVILPNKDYKEHNKLSIDELENKYLLSRTPQILEIQNNKPKIIRSLLNNTNIHQPRIYKNSLFKHKYNKYKEKYKKLLKKIYLLY